jgi:hypothetical protein
MKTYTLDEVTDKIVGKKGTPTRDKFEYELQMDLIGKAIKESRQVAQQKSMNHREQDLTGF